MEVYANSEQMQVISMRRKQETTGLSQGVSNPEDRLCKADLIKSKSVTGQLNAFG